MTVATTRTWVGAPARALVAMLAPLALAGGCDGDHVGQEPGGGPAAVFEPAPCTDSAPYDLEVACGRVKVPARRDDPAGGMLSVQVAVVRRKQAPAPAQTALYLDGGAGGSSIANLIYFAGWTPSRSLQALLATRTLVAIDLRGTGGSRPRLDCPGLALVPLPERAEQSGEFSPAAVAQCRGQLISEGIALPAFGTEAAADDVEDVRRALGLGRVDVIGADHGARVALELMRRHPQGLRAVVLDSVTAPDADALAEEGPALQQALERAFAECAADPACAGRFTPPEQAFAEVVARLDADPVEATTHGGSVRLDGRTFTHAVASLLRDGQPAGELAQRIDEARSGSYGYFAAVVGAPRGQGALGAHLSTVCAEQMSASSGAAIEEKAAALSAPVRAALASRFIALACPIWNVPAAPARLRARVTSGLPALLLAGERDPLIPPAFSRQVAASLSASRVLELPRQGHQLLHFPCGAMAAAAFLDNPAATPAVPDCTR